MARSMQKAIEDYKALCDKRGKTFGSFYTDDLDQIRKIAEDAGGINFRNIELHCIMYGMEAGYMIGYQAGLRDARKKNKG